MQCDEFGSAKRDDMIAHLTSNEAVASHTPCEHKNLTALALRALLRLRRSARGAICARALASELADALRLIIPFAPRTHNLPFGQS